MKEEQKVASLVTGSKIVKKHLAAVMKACVNCEGPDDDCYDPLKNPALKRAIKAAKRDGVPENYIQRVIQFATPGLHLDRLQDLRHRLGFGSLPHRVGPELQQFRLAEGRLPARRRSRTATGT